MVFKYITLHGIVNDLLESLVMGVDGKLKHSGRDLLAQEVGSKSFFIVDLRFYGNKQSISKIGKKVVLIKKVIQ